MKIKLGLVDDHQIFLQSLSMMLNSFNDFEVVLEATNGLDLQRKIATTKKMPEIILTDVTMPLMDGIETSKWLTQNYPSIKVIALSVNNNDYSIIAMIKAGCCTYLLKDIHASELEKAILEVHQKGYYNGDAFNINHRRLIINEKELGKIHLTEKEAEFLKHACSDFTYKQIAHLMSISERTVDGYRAILFEKLNVQSRVGMALEAIRKGFVKI